MSELSAHTRFFADDALYGRAPGTQGAATTALYVAAHFERFGLLPGGTDGSYLQKIPMLGITANPTISIETGARTVSLSFPTDFVAQPAKADSLIMVGGELTFVGYGVSAPERDWYDFKSTSLTGRVLLVLPGVPDALANIKGVSDVNAKVAEAARRGATGVLFVHSVSSEGCR